MKKYFTDIQKPKWYIIILGLILFTLQCLSIISLCFRFGGGYYLICPLQAVCGYLDVLLFLMIQKAAKEKNSLLKALLSILLGIAVSLLIFEGVYVSAPGAKGYLYGIVMQISMGMLFYAALQIVTGVFKNKNDTQQDTACKSETADGN